MLSLGKRDLRSRVRQREKSRRNGIRVLRKKK
jgi:hypothetical protein